MSHIATCDLVLNFPCCFGPREALEGALSVAFALRQENLFSSIGYMCVFCLPTLFLGFSREQSFLLCPAHLLTTSLTFSLHLFILISKFRTRILQGDHSLVLSFLCPWHTVTIDQTWSRNRGKQLSRAGGENIGGMRREGEIIELGGLGWGGLGSQDRGGNRWRNKWQ